LWDAEPGREVLTLRELWSAPGSAPPDPLRPPAVETGGERAVTTSNIGQHYVVALPVASGELGVIELFDSMPRDRDEAFLDPLAAIGSLIGQFVKRKRAEAQAERLKDEFFALVSHELRTPLTSVAGYVELLLEDPDAPADQREHFLQVIARNVGRLKRLVGDLLFVAQWEAGTLTLHHGTADLRQVVTQSVEAARPKAGQLEIGLDAALGDVPLLHADSERLGQAVDNLVSNAHPAARTHHRLPPRGWR